MKPSLLAVFLSIVATCFGATCGAAIAADTKPVKVVKLVSLEWPPYISEQAGEDSYVFQLAKQAFAIEGYELEVEFYPWARAVRKAEKGSANGLFPEYYSAAREAQFVFSDPFPSGPITLFKRRGDTPEFRTNPQQNEEKALSELRQYRFGVVRGYVNTEVLDNAGYLKREQARSDELNLRKLQYGRIDLAVIDPYVARYLLSTSVSVDDGELERMHPLLEKKSLHIAFPRRADNHQELLAAFNSGLQKLRESGRLEAMLRQYGFDDLADEVRLEQSN